MNCRVGRRRPSCVKDFAVRAEDPAIGCNPFNDTGSDAEMRDARRGFGGKLEGLRGAADDGSSMLGIETDARESVLVEHRVSGKVAFRRVVLVYGMNGNAIRRRSGCCCECLAELGLAAVGDSDPIDGA